MFPNKKGVTLVEMIVVVIIIAGLVAMAFPTFLTSIEKSRASEAVKVLSHFTAAQERYLADCSEQSGGVCVYADDLKKLPVGIHRGEITNATTMLTHSFTYTLDTVAGKIKAVTNNNSYAYTMEAFYNPTSNADIDVVKCIPSAGSKKEKDTQVCSALGKESGSAYIIN